MGSEAWMRKIKADATAQEFKFYVRTNTAPMPDKNRIAFFKRDPHKRFDVKSGVLIAEL